MYAIQRAQPVVDGIAGLGLESTSGLKSIAFPRTAAIIAAVTLAAGADEAAEKMDCRIVGNVAQAAAKTVACAVRRRRQRRRQAVSPPVRR